MAFKKLKTDFAPSGPRVGDDLMVDLETLGRGPGCAVLSIGAVFFGPDGLGAEFELFVNTADSLERGLTKDPDTVAWWDRQSKEAQETLRKAETSPHSLADALGAFSAFCMTHSSQAKLKFWGNGASFDNAIVAYCYRAAGMNQPWNFWNDMCYRTLKKLASPAIAQASSGVLHNALDDAKRQAEHARRILLAAGVW